jgi:hypothetical protein
MLSALLPITDILGKRAVLEALGALFHSIVVITRIIGSYSSTPALNVGTL